MSQSSLIGRVQAEEEEWQKKLGLTTTTANRMAYATIAASPGFFKSTAEYQRNYWNFKALLVFEGVPTAGVNSPIFSWRFPGSNMSLLQLAAICNNASATNDLADVWTNPDLDGPGENRPLHLACAHGHWDVVERLRKILKNFVFKEGSVTVALNPSFIPEAPVVYLDTPLQGSCLDLALQNKHIPFAFYLVTICFDVLEEENVVQAIKCLWFVLDLVQESGQLGEICLPSLLTHPDWNSEVNYNLFLLCCQLLNAHERKESRSKCSKSSEILRIMVSQAICNKRLDLLSQAAQYCTRPQLHMIISFLEGVPHARHRPLLICDHHRFWMERPDSEEMATALKVFQDEKQGRTLQHEALLTILRSVGGDARRAKTLSDLPQKLLELFPVPFQDLYDRLTGSSQ